MQTEVIDLIRAAIIGHLVNRSGEVWRVEPHETGVTGIIFSCWPESKPEVIVLSNSIASSDDLAGLASLVRLESEAILLYWRKHCEHLQRSPHSEARNGLPYPEWQRELTIGENAMHDHECEHNLKYCSVCDVVYCTKCKREWGGHRHSQCWPWGYTYPTTAPANLNTEYFYTTASDQPACCHSAL